MSYSPAERRPTLAPSPETDAIAAAIGLLTNAVTEYEARSRHTHLVVPEDRDAEDQYLQQQGEWLDAEQRRITAWSRDLQQRQIASGLLTPQMDGTFRVNQAAAPAPRQPITLPKISTGAVLTVVCVLAAAVLLFSGAGPAIFSLLFVMTFLLGLPALVIKKLIFDGRPARGARPDHAALMLEQARREQQRLAVQEAEAAEYRSAQAAAEQEARRQERITRAAAAAPVTDDDGWDD